MSSVGTKGETDIKVTLGETQSYGDRDIQRDTKGSRTDIVRGRMID